MPQPLFVASTGVAFLSSAKHWLLSGLALAFLTSCQVAPPAEPAAFTLHVAHINDTHSAFDPTPGYFWADMQDAAPVADPATGKQQVFNQWGGHPRLAQQLQQIRSDAQRTGQALLTLHGGDAWQGSAYFQVNQGQMNADILSRMGIDAMALGNHEFDLNNGALNDFINAVNFPVVAGNIDASNDPDLKQQANLKPYQLFHFGEQVVAVIGVVLDNMPSIAPNTGEVVFHDMVQATQQHIDRLHADGVDKIIVLSHIGNALDVQLAQQVSGIDAIVGGHSHSLLGDFSNIGLANSSRPYAELVHHSVSGSPTCIVQAGEYAQAIGLVALEFNAQGELLSCIGQNTLLTSAQWFQDRAQRNSFSTDQQHAIRDFIEVQPNMTVVDEHPALREHIDTHYRPAMEKAYGRVIAYLDAPIEHVRRPGDSGSDQHGSRLAPLVAQAQLEFASSEAVQALTGVKPDLALVGAGGMRASLAAGELREGVISLELLPFASQLSVLQVPGEVIRQVIEQTVTATLPEGAHAGRFPYGAQLRYEFIESKAGTHGELRQLEINQGTLTAPNWQPLHDKQTYTLVLNSYLANGNDGWTALYEAQQEPTAVTNPRRFDLFLTSAQGNKNELTVRSVSHVEPTGQGGFRALYHRQNDNEVSAHQPCSDPELSCHTDAMAVIDFFLRHRDEAETIIRHATQPTVTLRRQ